MPMWFYSESLNPVTITYQDHQEATEAVSAHTFTSMGIGTASAGRYVIATLGFFTSVARTISSVTIGGVTATQIDSTVNVSIGGEEYTAMFIALVPTGTTADVVLTLSGQGADWACTTNSMVGVSSATPASTATSTANNPTASMSCGSGGAIIGCAMARQIPAPTATWAGITEDSDNIFATFNCFTSAHTNFQNSQSGLSCTCTFSGTLGSVGLFAAFDPS